ncbi:MAG TPA: hypothetical protein VMY77_17440, partial [Chitinophagaceae bacterium]|nr:hypothetical protein [Chitinophagaceae bacterium]
MKTILVILLLYPVASFAQELLLKNDRIARKFVFDGKAWRTSAFIQFNSKDTLHVRSKEVYILPMGAEKGFDISAFRADKTPALFTAGDTTILMITYSSQEKELP